MSEERRGREKVREYFGDEPPREEPELKASLFWPAIRAIAIISTAIYLIVVLVVNPLASFYSSLPRNSPKIINICAFTQQYSCEVPMIDNGTVSFRFIQNSNTELFNSTLYLVPLSANFSPQEASQFPRSQNISRMFSGEALNVTFAGGSADNAPASTGSYTANIVLSSASSAYGVQTYSVIGYLTVTPNSRG
jgi:hypothetical protein